MRSLVLLLEQTLSQTVFRKAAAHLRNLIDFSGGDGETVYDIIRREYDQKLPPDYHEGSVTRRFERLLRRWSYDEVVEAYEELEHRFLAGKIKVWREITAPPSWTPDQQHPGLYWSWDEGAAEAHWGSFVKGHVKWLIEAEIAFQDVAWTPTLAANAHPSYYEEREITLIEGRPVNIISVRQVR